MAPVEWLSDAAARVRSAAGLPERVHRPDVRIRRTLLRARLEIEPSRLCARPLRGRADRRRNAAARLLPAGAAVLRRAESLPGAAHRRLRLRAALRRQVAIL